jgi:hypothetical protein
MTLLTAHKILIGTAVAFFLFYALWEFTGARGTGGPGGWRRGAASLAGAGVLAIYFTTLRRPRVANVAAPPDSRTGIQGGPR